MKPFVKMDMITYIIFLLVSIIIPPLFIINLIIFLVQVIPRAIIAAKENKENKEYEKWQRKQYEEKQRKEFEEMLKKLQEIEQQNNLDEKLRFQKEEASEEEWWI